MKWFHIKKFFGPNGIPELPNSNIVEAFLGYGKYDEPSIREIFRFVLSGRQYGFY